SSARRASSARSYPRRASSRASSSPIPLDAPVRIARICARMVAPAPFWRYLVGIVHFRRALMKRMVSLLVLLSLAIAFPAAAAQTYSAPSEFSRDAIGVKSYPAAPRLAEQAAIAPAATLGAAAETAPEELAALREWNDAGRLPLKNGFTRAIGDPI